MNDFEKCRVCNKKLEPHCATHGFCSPACLQIHKTQGEAKIEKFEEIKRIALNVFVHNNCCIDSVGAWEEAEHFYEYAKEKEKNE